MVGPVGKDWPRREVQRRRRYAERSLEHLRQRYADDNNPVHVARAWRECRDAGVPFPEFVIAYLDRAFGRIAIHARATSVRPKRIESAIAAAFEFGAADMTAKSRVNPFRDRQLEQAHLALLVWAKAAAGQSLNSAWTDVATENRLSKATVRLAWKAHGADFDLSGTRYVPPPPRQKPRRRQV